MVARSCRMRALPPNRHRTAPGRPSKVLTTPRPGHADLAGMLELYRQPHIKGFTTNPTLMRKAGITDYESFARQVLTEITDRPVSFEVFADDFPTMAAQARELASWGKNVAVKIPIVNTKGESALPLIKELSHEGMSLNVTAVMTLEQTKGVIEAAKNGVPLILSIFAGRIADTGRERGTGYPGANIFSAVSASDTPHAHDTNRVGDAFIARTPQRPRAAATLRRASAGWQRVPADRRGCRAPADRSRGRRAADRRRRRSTPCTATARSACSRRGPWRAAPP